MKLVCLIVSLILSVVFAQEIQTKPSSVLAIEGDFKVRQLVVPGFDELPLERKLFAYYLAQAGMAGKDIFWQQASREGLAIRNLFEKLWGFSNSWTPEQRKNISEYLYKLYANHANYDYMGNFKLVLKGFTEKQLVQLARSDKKLRREIRRLSREILDPNYKNIYMASAPADLIAATHTDFYGRGFTQADFESMPPETQQEFLSYPKKTVDGKIESESIRIGGKYSPELTSIDFYLSQAQNHATDAEKEILAAYRKALQSGKTEDLRHAETLWVQHKATDIEFQVGFIEAYHDPMRVRGAWEAFVFLLAKDAQTKDRVERIRNNASYFESSMPVDPRFQKAPGFTPPQAEGAFMILGSGESGERPFAGVNLPNDEKISEVYGTKSFGNLNVLNDLNQGGDQKDAHLRKWLPKEYHSFIPKFDYAHFDTLQVELHEILGHGSGQNLPGVSDNMMKETYSSLEEMRAETASLYQLMDPKMIEFGVLPQMDSEEFDMYRKSALSMFFADYINKYDLLADDATEITQAHRRAALVMLNFLRSRNVIEVQAIEGEYPHVLVKDAEAARKTLGELWSWIQTAKSTGDYDLSVKLFTEYAGYEDFHKNLRRLVKARIKAENLPTQSMHLNPNLKLIKNEKGEIVDVSIEYHDFSQKDRSAVIRVVDRMHSNNRNSKELIKTSQSLSCRHYFN